MLLLFAETDDHNEVMPDTVKKRQYDIGVAKLPIQDAVLK